ncbi:hypothetical protein HII12_002760 [Brettanomyces bruxellensis]|uniref:Vacuolar membrane-associated protein IML1 n=1 Tax=Dekkera bruxellensis TaxID=5007 RepID=A0A8H6EUT5_DEKBR|nr:hypothetical protein HII12_002760 [Brettanomyces bruxellensis]
MARRPRIQFDLSRSRNRASQRTNEASLIVGRRGTESELVSVTEANTDSQSEQNSQRTRSTRNGPMRIVGGDTESRMASIGRSNEAGKDDTPGESSSRGTPGWARLSVRFHEPGKWSEDVVVDPGVVPGAVEGGVGQLRCEEGSSRQVPARGAGNVGAANATLGNADAGNAGAGNEGAANAASAGIGPKTISVKSGPIQKLLDLKPRSPVVVGPVSREQAEADVVEIYIRDLHVSRGDMWNLAGLLVHGCVYRTQRLSFLQGSIRGDVQRMYRRGKKVFSAYVGESTRVVFRSESARLVVFIQISLEMWHFEESGQQMFYKLVNSLFPKVFKRWKKLGTHHLISIVLFTSVDLDEGRNTRYAAGERPPKRQDYYRVVVDQVSITLWNEIMATLRLEFANFKRDILLGPNRKIDHDHPQQYLIRGNFLPAVKGNLLEAINLGMSLVSDDFRDPDLWQTTNHLIVISPGNGLFDVDHEMLVGTGRMLATVDSTIDVICLSQPPLHVVPLFRYLDSNHKTHHCIPNFMDISFWSDASQSVHQWLPRCKIYELQMMGVMENELTSVSIQDLSLGRYSSAVDAMGGYDSAVFRPAGGADARRAADERHHADARRARTSDAAEPRRTGLRSSLQASLQARLQAKEIPSVQAAAPTTSSATGITTTSKPNISAFSSLLSISKNNQPRSGLPRALEFVKRLISSPGGQDGDGETRVNVHPGHLDASSSHSGDLGPHVNGSSTHLDALNEHTDAFSTHTDTLSTHLDAPSLHSNMHASMHAASRFNAHPLAGVHTRAAKHPQQKKWNAYWTVVQNPSNVTTSELFGLVSYGRWQFVFPPNVRRRIIKWTSLATPAALPVMTPLFPTSEDFNQNFTFRIYDVLPNPGGVNGNTGTSETLMRSMISLRVSLGFQICVGDRVRCVEDQRKPNGDSKMLVEYLEADHYEGSRIYLSLSDEIHRISCDYNGLVNVQVYRRIASGGAASADTDYVGHIRTRYSEVYRPVTVHLSREGARDYNWNRLDQVLAGYSDSGEGPPDGQPQYHRLKFAVIPTNLPENSFKLASESLTPEEIRLEGIRSLVATINRNRLRTPEERRARPKKSEIMPEINFYTGNLFSYLDNQANLEFSGGVRPTQLFHGPAFDKSVSLARLASALQAEGGIKIADRKWHLLMHYHCFTGTDLVSWLIENFQDIDDRQGAVDYGNTLMERGLFRHVKSKHHFLDGHYFYELNVQYLGEGKGEKGQRGNIEQERNIEQEKNEGEQKNTASSTPPKRKVVLSRKVIYNLDPNQVSWQPEIMNVHYDIVHNPEHCFHIRLEWLNTTSKLIEDTVSSWAKHCERYGLELVEVPWDELCTLPLANPLHSTIDIHLALDPWSDHEFACHTSILNENRYFYHLYLLERCHFMLDNRTANLFRDDRFDVVYSWGRPRFKYAQFVHRTGAYIAELRENGNFFLAPNNPHIARVNLSIGQLQGNNNSTVYFDSQGVMLDFRAICSDRTMLRVIFREALAKFERSRDVELALFEDDDEASDTETKGEA